MTCSGDMNKRRPNGRNDPPEFQFEEVGNFIYTISRREMDKVAAGLNLGPVAFNAFNDCFLPGVGEAKPVAGDPVFEKIQRELRRLDVLCKLRFRQPRMLTAILFKSAIDGAMRDNLRQHRFEISDRPANPYVSR